MTKYKDNFVEKVIIEIPKELISKKRKYKIINQFIEVEHFLDICIVHNDVTLKMPMFFLDVGSILKDIKEMCISMSNNEMMVQPMGWADSECKSYKILITKIKKIGGERGLTRNE